MGWCGRVEQPLGEAVVLAGRFIYTWEMTLTLNLPVEAQARLEAEASRRGITLDLLVAELAAGFPVDTGTPRRKLAFVGMGSSKAGISHQLDELLADGFGRD